MKAAVLTEKGIKINEVPKPNVGVNDVLIKNMAVGICGTDISIVKGDYRVPLPRILGHEIAGVVEQIGTNVKDIQIGDRVTSEINISCGKCYFCKKGEKTQCLKVKALGIYIDGGFAEYTVTPSYNVHKIGNINFDDATFIEPLAAAINTFEMSPLKEDHKNIVIIGTGKLGLLILQVAKLTGRKIIAVGRSHLNIATKLGADFIIDVKKDDFEKKIMEITDGIGADVVVETTGNPNGIEMGMKIIRNRGLFCLKSTHGLMVPIDVTAIVVKELHIQGSRCGNFQHTIKLFDKINVKPLISGIFNLDNIDNAFKMAQNSENIKIIIHPND
ncbi:MAG: zinc-dependent alcohol dehydrogenase [Candidatus Helarchaeota archaeon]